MNPTAWLDRILLDWNRPEEASRISREIAQELASNRALLRSMVLAAATNGDLKMLAEKHNELNYIVLYDALDRGFRLRLHRFSKGLEDIPHNHRFSFSSAILSGSYIHTMYNLLSSVSGQSVTPWTLDQPIGSFIDKSLEHIAVTGLQEVLQTRQIAGTSYTMSHHAIHKTAMPEEDAFSVFVRSPAQKRCSLQLEPEKRTYRWKFGREEEAPDITNKRVMNPAEYSNFIESLEEAKVI
jgi:hypothetical protein